MITSYVILFTICGLAILEVCGLLALRGWINRKVAKISRANIQPKKETGLSNIGNNPYVQSLLLLLFFSTFAALLPGSYTLGERLAFSSPAWIFISFFFIYSLKADKNENSLSEK